ncbi:MAG TPA: hypothetical protein VG817_02475 [Gemmatimonadales bacterium]|nr:hypothetical protein [Gemmatimonadales bacterium]
MSAVVPRTRSLPQLEASPPAAVHPPPFSLPGAHFGAALLWLGAAAGGLVLVAPHLAAGNLFDPRVFAVTHGLTLGVITTTIFGALYQLFPVTMGRAVRHLGAAYLTLALLQLGTLCVVAGFWDASARLQGSGWGLIAVATLLLGVNLVSQCLDTRPEPLIGRYVGGGYLALLGALALGLVRIAESLGYGHVDRLAMIATHFHLAAFGFATLITIGVGHRMLPMFLVSHGAPRWLLRWSGSIIGAGLLLFAAGALAAARPVSLVAVVLLGVGGVLYLDLAWEYFRCRARRQLDPGLAHVAVAHGFLFLAVAGGITLAVSRMGFTPRWWAAYGITALLGWLVLLIIGVLYKILPFLAWLHLFGSRMGEPALPTVADLTRTSWAWASLAALALGTVVLGASVLAGHRYGATAGALLVAAGVGLVLAQVVRALVLRRKPAQSP